MLVDICKKCWRAIERDLISVGLRMRDLGNVFTIFDLASIVLESPPGSAVFHRLSKGWSRGDHLLASMIEVQSGLVCLTSRYERPGVEPGKAEPKKVAPTGFKNTVVDVMTFDEFIERREHRRASGGDKCLTM